MALCSSGKMCVNGEVFPFASFTSVGSLSNTGLFFLWLSATPSGRCVFLQCAVPSFHIWHLTLDGSDEELSDEEVVRTAETSTNGGGQEETSISTFPCLEGPLPSTLEEWERNRAKSAKHDAQPLVAPSKSRPKKGHSIYGLLLAKHRRVSRGERKG